MSSTPPSGAASASTARARTEHSFLEKLVGSLRRRRAAHGTDVRAERMMAVSHALLSERGEISGSSIATDLLTQYRALDPAGRSAFFDRVAIDFAPDAETIGKLADAYRLDPSPSQLLRLQRAIESPRQELFRRIAVAPEGILALVQLRRDMLRDLESRPEWAPVDADLLHLFRSWFNRAFLELRQIDWHTSAVVLEKLIEYEAVHQIQGWRDLRRRLQGDRRCYGFFHQALADEPIIFIEVALTKGIAGEVQPLLDPDSAVSDVSVADSALFYSITNCQEGLRGVSFGNLLIKQVAEHLRRELPQVRTFATLSPIPGFRQWLTEISASNGHSELARLLAELERPEWWRDEALARRLQPAMLPLSAHYLLHATRGRQPLDAVARFHLGNGARLERVNWLGDTSPTGLRRSFGITANYVYDLSEVERNHENYCRDFKVTASRRFERLAARSVLGAPAAASGG